MLEMAKFQKLPLITQFLIICRKRETKKIKRISIFG